MIKNVDWRYFDKFEDVIDKYMPFSGEGETKASQTVTAINKLIYKWYNDGDVYDNTYCMAGWCNDLSDFANWLYYNVDAMMLDKINDCYSMAEYENILKDLADTYLRADVLEKLETEKEGSIYKCKGKFKFEEEEF